MFTDLLAGRLRADTAARLLCRGPGARTQAHAVMRLQGNVDVGKGGHHTERKLTARWALPGKGGKFE